jgi:hypothetical protein
VPSALNAFGASNSRFDKVLAQSGDFRMVPALGMLVPGYFLITTVEHNQSMAQLGGESLKKLETWLIRLTGTLSPVFGEYLLFEHGDCTTESIDHAHLHLIPLAQKMQNALLSSVEWKSLSAFVCLQDFSSHSYLYLGLGGRHFVLPRPGLGSQWVRRIIGAELGRDDWDWAVSAGEAELTRTFDMLPPAFAGAL